MGFGFVNNVMVGAMHGTDSSFVKYGRSPTTFHSYHEASYTTGGHIRL